MATTHPDGWLHKFPPEAQDTIRHWFLHVRSRGVTNPAALLSQTEVLVGDKLAWCTTPETRQICHNTLEAMRCNRAAALAYAAALLASLEG
jgi:hypothetical protein